MLAESGKGFGPPSHSKAASTTPKKTQKQAVTVTDGDAVSDVTCLQSSEAWRPPCRHLVPFRPLRKQSGCLVATRQPLLMKGKQQRAELTALRYLCLLSINKSVKAASTIIGLHSQNAFVSDTGEKLGLWETGRTWFSAT